LLEIRQLEIRNLLCMFFRKTNLIILVIIICIIGLIIASIFYFTRDKEGEDVDVNAELEALKEANRENMQGLSQFKNSLSPLNQDDHLWGNIEAPIKIIVYSDFDCPFSAQFSAVIEKIKEEYPEKVVIAMRHYFFSNHPNAWPAALAAECAAEQGKFWAMQEKIFQAKRDNKLSVSKLKEGASELGLDEDKFNQCLDGKKYKDKVHAQVAEAQVAGAVGTPTVFVNDIILPGAYPFEDFINSGGEKEEGMRSIIEKLIENSKHLPAGEAG